MAPAFKDLFTPSRYKAYYGGRGSGKSTSVAMALITKATKEPLRILCCREIQKSIKDSSKRLLDDIIEKFQLQGFYTSTETEIRGANGSLFLFAGLKTNPEAIKSMEGVDIAWVEEADRVSQRSLDLLIPTIRKNGSEIWFTWNPNSELDAVDMMFRGKNPPPTSIIKQVNFGENPFFPDVLAQESQFDKKTDPAKYQHVWLGGYRQMEKGAYYTKQITDAISENRISHVPHDPLLPVHCYFDLGMADLTTIWFVQYVGPEVHFIDYYEVQYSSAVEDAVILNGKGYKYATLWLPHDGEAKQKGTGKSIKQVYQGLGFDVKTVPITSIMTGIDATRTLFPRFYFDAEKCGLGLRALKAYHEKWDEDLNIGRGPDHDWSSHAADALRYCAVAYGFQNTSSQNLVNAMKGYANKDGNPLMGTEMFTVNQQVHIPANYYQKNRLTL